MGRLIDADELVVELAEHAYDDKSFDEILDNIPIIETIQKSDYEEQIKINNKLVNDNEQLRAYITMMQADYNARLKADLVAMLEEIDLEMSEQSFGIQTEPWEAVEELRKKIIRQKINALKGEV